MDIREIIQEKMKTRSEKQTLIQTKDFKRYKEKRNEVKLVVDEAKEKAWEKSNHKTTKKIIKIEYWIKNRKEIK